MTLNPHIKHSFSILPLIIFFIGYKWLGLYGATGLMLVATITIIAITYAAERRIELSPLITAIVVVIFGGLTLWFHDERFIKMKPTLIYLLFALILLTGTLCKKNLLKPLLGIALHLNEAGWRILSLRWGIFFLCLALLNEYVWRHFSTDTWVNFKIFGLLGLNLVFMVFQVRLIQHYSVDPPSTKENSAVKN